MVLLEFLLVTEFNSKIRETDYHDMSFNLVRPLLFSSTIQQHHFMGLKMHKLLFSGPFFLSEQENTCLSMWLQI